MTKIWPIVLCRYAICKQKWRQNLLSNGSRDFPSLLAALQLKDVRFSKGQDNLKNAHIPVSNFSPTIPDSETYLHGI